MGEVTKATQHLPASQQIMSPGVFGLAENAVGYVTMGVGALAVTFFTVSQCLADKGNCCSKGVRMFLMLASVAILLFAPVAADLPKLEGLESLSNWDLQVWAAPVLITSGGLIGGATFVGTCTKAQKCATCKTFDEHGKCIVCNEPEHVDN